MAVNTDNRYNISIWQGSTFGLSIIIKDENDNVQNLDGATATMQVRTSYDSGVITEQLSSFTGEISINGVEGRLDIFLDDIRTANIPVDLTNGKPPKTSYVYDLELTDPNGQVSKVIWGDFTVYGEVTRS